MLRARVLFWTAALLSLCPPPATSHIFGQQCDWSGSGLRGGEERGVRPVYLRCREGKVRWSYPAGALRVLLRLGSSGREFRACIKPSPSFKAASIFLEGPKSLNKLYSPDTATLGHVRCFQSRGGQAALYVEATQAETFFKKQVAEFAYDLEPMPRGKMFDPYEECRPCTKDEMTQAFCTSELVARGVVQRVEPVEETDVSKIFLKVGKVLRHSALEDNEIPSSSSSSPVEEKDVVPIQVGRHCGAQHGPGQVVLMARRKLGSLVLKCAAWASDWTAAVKEANAKDTAHCLLSS